MSEASQSSLERWQRVRAQYHAFLEVVEQIQADIAKGALPPSSWPHAEAAAARMGVSPETVEQIVHDWDAFVDAALLEFREVDDQPRSSS